MYYSYIEIECVATSFSPARTDLAVKLLKYESDCVRIGIGIRIFMNRGRFCERSSH